MWRFQPYTGNYADDFQQIVAAKKDAVRKTLLDHASLVLDRYHLYETFFSQNRLEEITKSPFRNNESSLIGCYKSPVKVFQQIKKNIREIQPANYKWICPYCAILKSGTYDHYLPISDFPEFSVNGYNLIPCCQECNKKKDTFWKASNGKRGIINFYLDLLPTSQFLFALIEYDGKDAIPRIRFYLKQPKEVSNDFYSLIESHFNRLSLCKRYQEEAINEISQTRLTLQSYLPGSDANDIREALERETVNLMSIYGNNYWKAVLKLSLSKSHLFIESLIK